MKKFLYILLILNILFLTGCWNYHEIEDFAIASALTIDKDANNNYSVMAQIIEISPSQSGVGFDVNFVEAKGKSIFEATRNMIPIAQKRLYWSHAKIIVISEEIAKDGIVPILDWVMRDPFPRPTIHIYVSKNKTAKEILKNENKSTKVQDFEFEETIKALEVVSNSPHIEAYRLTNQVFEDYIYSVLPTVELLDGGNNLNIDISGSAFFRSAKLQGFLDPMDTMKYLFVRNEVKSGFLVVPLDEENKEYITLQIIKNKTKTKATVNNDKISIVVNLKTHVGIAEIDNSVDYTSKEGQIFVKDKTEKYLEKEIKNLITKMQKEYNLDIFLFGDRIRKDYPTLWKEIQKDWDSIYKDLDVIVNSTIVIKNSGQILSPIKAGD